MALIKLCLEPKISKCSLSWICPVLSCVLEQIQDVTLREKNTIISVTASEKYSDAVELKSLSSSYENRASPYQWPF